MSAHAQKRLRALDWALTGTKPNGLSRCRDSAGSNHQTSLKTEPQKTVVDVLALWRYLISVPRDGTWSVYLLRMRRLVMMLSLNVGMSSLLKSPRKIVLCFQPNYETCHYMPYADLPSLTNVRDYVCVLFVSMFIQGEISYLFV